MAKDPSRTESATPKRLNKARGEGNVAKSQEVAKTLTILAGLIGLYVWAQYMGKSIMGLFRHFLSQAVYFNPTEENVFALGPWLALELAKIMLPVILFIGAMVYIAIRLQVGKLWTTKVFEFKWSRFNLFAGLKRMFISFSTLARMAKSLAQALCIGFAPWLVLKAEIPFLIRLYDMPAAGVAVYILSIGSKMVLYALVPMTIIAGIDWWYTRWKYAEDMKMTKDEVKDERKQAEGDPVVKTKLRQKMLQMGARRMLQDVPKADVVITNPTHIAVALRYAPDEAPAPVIIAMGAGHLALKIREVARENSIPIRENKPLAQALYKQVNVGDAIPAEMFQAVAIILAQIWKTRPPKRNPPQ